MVVVASGADAADGHRRHHRRHLHPRKQRRRPAPGVVTRRGAGGRMTAALPTLLCILLLSSPILSSSALLLHVPRLSGRASPPGGTKTKTTTKTMATWPSYGVRTTDSTSRNLIASSDKIHRSQTRHGGDDTITQEEELRRMVREARELGRRRAAARPSRSTQAVHGERTEVVPTGIPGETSRGGAASAREEMGVDSDGRFRGPAPSERPMQGRRATAPPMTTTETTRRTATTVQRRRRRVPEVAGSAERLSVSSGGDAPLGRRSFVSASAALVASSLLAAVTCGGPGGTGVDTTASSAATASAGARVQTSEGATPGARAPPREIPGVKNVTSPNSPAPAVQGQPTTSPTKQKQKQFEPINITKVAQENEINVTLLCPSAEVLGGKKTLFAHLTTATDQHQRQHRQLATVCKTVDRESYTRVTTKVGGPLLPPWLRPRVVESIPDDQLLVAGIVAGGVVECARTAILYPLLTVRNRIMAEGTTDDVAPAVVAPAEDGGPDPTPLPYYISSEVGSGGHVGTHRGKDRGDDAATPAAVLLRRKIQVLHSSFVYHLAQGNLYAGLVPSLLVNVPAMGVYAGIRDVSKRALSRVIWGPGKLDDVVVSLLGALVADVASLAVKTPADLLSVRLQVLKGNATVAERYRNETATIDEGDHCDGSTGEGYASAPSVAGRKHEDAGGAATATAAVPPAPVPDRAVLVGDWFRDSLRRLPATVACDLPYLLVRIAVNWAVATGHTGGGGGGGLGRCELQTILVACACAAATTPFHVAQTRIFLAPTGDDDDADGASTMGEEGGVERGNVGGRGLLPPEGGIWNTMQRIVRENDGGVSNLYAGWIERTAYLGLGRAWLDPIRVIGYLGIRDAVLLSWFD